MSKDPVGSVAEEAAKLFAALQHAATDAPPRPEPAPEADAAEADAPPAAEEHEHKLGPDCMWCPVCQLIHRVRNTSPETIEQLSTAAAHLLGSLRSLLEAAADAARQAREDATSRPASSAQPEEEPAPPKVDRIDVSEDPEPWD